MAAMESRGRDVSDAIVKEFEVELERRQARIDHLKVSSVKAVSGKTMVNLFCFVFSKTREIEK